MSRYCRVRKYYSIIYVRNAFDLEDYTRLFSATKLKAVTGGRGTLLPMKVEEGGDNGECDGVGNALSVLHDHADNQTQSEVWNEGRRHGRKKKKQS